MASHISCHVQVCCCYADSPLPAALSIVGQPAAAALDAGIQFLNILLQLAHDVLLKALHSTLQMVRCCWCILCLLDGHLEGILIRINAAELLDGHFSLHLRTVCRLKLWHYTS